MKRQSISITAPNEEWIKAQIAREEYASKSELVNDLIRKARIQYEEAELIRAKLKSAESSGFTNMSREEILEDIKSELKRDGKL